VNRTLRFGLKIAVAAALLAAVPGAAAAQRLYNFSVSALGGIGGATDANPGGGIGNPSYQLGFAVVTEPGTLVGLRLGTIDFGSNQVGNLVDASLNYLTVAGEYRFQESYFDSGLYLGLGGYQLKGTRPGGGSNDKTAIGLALGATGEFTLSRRLGVLIELSGHYSDLDEAKFFGMIHGGLIFHF
jgi:hypothetical protein